MRPPLIISVVCGPIATNMENNLHKIHDVIDNGVIIVRKLAAASSSFIQSY